MSRVLKHFGEHLYHCQDKIRFLNSSLFAPGGSVELVKDKMGTDAGREYLY